jgi:hypothetical protein
VGGEDPQRLPAQSGARTGRGRECAYASRDRGGRLAPVDRELRRFDLRRERRARGVLLAPAHAAGGDLRERIGDRIRA